MKSLKSYILWHKFDNIPYDFTPKNRDELITTIIQITREHYNDPVIDLNEIDTSRITDMHDLFKDLTEFKYDVSKWDVRNVKNMRSMFNNCMQFNCDISKWDVRKVEDMSFMFNGCTQFNSDLSKWDVHRVKYMGNMFFSCMQFKCDLSKWDVRNVKDVESSTDIFMLAKMSEYTELQPKFE